jgi:Protein of unknown function (DUF1173)
MSSYQVANQIISLGDPEATPRLVEAHSRRERPLCLCRQPPIEMYIAKRGDKYFVKRMPNTGADQDPACESYAPPAELSGLGEVLGSAIQESVDNGTTVLKLAFSLTRLPGRAPAKGDHRRIASRRMELSSPFAARCITSTSRLVSTSGPPPCLVSGAGT